METVNLEKIKSRRQQIIAQLYADLESTPEAGRFYSTHNIETCAADLDAYIDRLSQSRDGQGIEDAIDRVCRSLSTFQQDDESPEFLWGFLYNGYTRELSHFIRDAAFAFGLKRGEPQVINTHVFHIKHNPHSLDLFRVYIGATSDDGVVLDYNPHTSQFEYLENPYGESCALPVFDLAVDTERTSLSFDVLAGGVYRSIRLKAQQPADNVLFGAIQALHNGGSFDGSPGPGYCSLELEMTEGMLTRLTTMNYDADNRIINMFTKGTGMKIFVQELDADGCFQNSGNMASHPEIVDEKFVIVDAVPQWKYYEIGSLDMKEDVVTVRTKGPRYEYADDARNKVVTRETAGRTIGYPVRTFHFIQALLLELLQARLPFKSRF